MLLQIIESIPREKLIEIYNGKWKNGEQFSDNDLRKHITSYITMYYNMCHCDLVDLEHRQKYRRSALEIDKIILKYKKLCSFG